MPETLFLIDGPFVSEFIKQTIYDLQIPVVKTPEAAEYLDESRTYYVEPELAKLKLSQNPDSIVYTNSENALEWIYKNHPDRELVDSLHLAKDKVRFRETMQSLTPEFYFQEVKLTDLSSMDVAAIPFPVIVKPAVGFFSLGVYGVRNGAEWEEAIRSIHDSVSEIQGLYPSAVLDSSYFIIEEVISGEEFAVDCSFDASGQVRIYNIMKHLFASEEDMNDRVYITSVEVMDEHLARIRSYLDRVGKLFDFRSFPAHIELRITSGGEINIIEVNPLRFGGWCSTPDLAHHAWGVNVYECLYNDSEPDWSHLLQKEQDFLHALIVLNNSTGVKGSNIESFNYDELISRFDKPLELRKTNYMRFPLFGFLMCEVAQNDQATLHDILHSDLNEYIEI